MTDNELQIARYDNGRNTCAIKVSKEANGGEIQRTRLANSTKLDSGQSCDPQEYAYLISSEVSQHAGTLLNRINLA